LKYSAAQTVPAFAQWCANTSQRFAFDTSCLPVGIASCEMVSPSSFGRGTDPRIPATSISDAYEWSDSHRWRVYGPLHPHVGEYHLLFRRVALVTSWTPQPDGFVVSAPRLSSIPFDAKRLLAVKLQPLEFPNRPVKDVVVLEPLSAENVVKVFHAHIKSEAS
jgi:hypothetical protein